MLTVNPPPKGNFCAHDGAKDARGEALLISMEGCLVTSVASTKEILSRNIKVTG